jgi:hypothetical protein
MRIAIMAVLSFGVLGAIGVAPAAAVGIRYPYCIQGNDQPGLSNCTFTSYEQCQATASGRFLACIANPYYLGNGDDPRAYVGRRRPPPPSYFPGYRAY